jgi:hypothetical protein
VRAISVDDDAGTRLSRAEALAAASLISRADLDAARIAKQRATVDRSARDADIAASSSVVPHRRCPAHEHRRGHQRSGHPGFSHLIAAPNRSVTGLADINRDHDHGAAHKRSDNNIVSAHFGSSRQSGRGGARGAHTNGAVRRVGNSPSIRFVKHTFVHSGRFCVFCGDAPRHWVRNPGDEFWRRCVSSDHRSRQSRREPCSRPDGGRYAVQPPA